MRICYQPAASSYTQIVNLSTSLSEDRDELLTVSESKGIVDGRPYQTNMMLLTTKLVMSAKLQNGNLVTKYDVL